ncbi:MAG: heme ABC exporter ATP-binding protein CcmA [Pseudomonadota bacterium]
MKFTVDGLAVSRGEDQIFHDISFSVASGTAFIIKGANGSGKSTLLRALAGLLEWDEGSVTLEDAPGAFSEAALPQMSHFLAHENAMKPQMTVGENLSFWQEFCGHPDVSPEEALDYVGLSGLEDVPFAHLSTGQRRRSAIARLLVSARPVWLLDEPTAGLDAASEKQFAGLMEAHLEDGGIIVAATHVPLHLSKTVEYRLLGADT